VAAVQYNYRVSFRATPDDHQYPRQSENFARAGYENAWTVSTGGSTPGGVPIVTAILDAGFDVGHEDLRPSLWRNPDEIPGDGIDNDGNGYVDDRHGWDFVSQSGSYRTDRHGTQVAGLLGASGDNGIGVSGTNWDSHLMLLVIGTVADVIAAYDYVIDQRRRWRQSSGEAGAFVVSTNASFGVEGATCADFPVWGAMYDRLGAEGILTAASVVNVDRDVETFGDMPVDCPSEFLIGVTNVDAGDRRFSSAGFGRLSVDLGAPGEGSFTTYPNDRYGNFGSTSAAAPYVTGAINLLYSLNCPELMTLARNEPPEAAKRIRQTLLSTTRSGSGLSDITATGGVIDVASAAETLLESCRGAVGEDRLLAFPNPAGEQITLRSGLDQFTGVPRVVVYTPAGRLAGNLPIRSVDAFPAAVTVGVSGLPAGMYVAELTDGSRTYRTKVIVY
jgi:hypothetical protein